jgi:hypothetical protein
MHGRSPPDLRQNFSRAENSLIHLGDRLKESSAAEIRCGSSL